MISGLGWMLASLVSFPIPFGSDSAPPPQPFQEPVQDPLPEPAQAPVQEPAAQASQDQAAGPAAPLADGSDGWNFAVRPYFWAASLNGTVSVGSLPPQEFDKSFSDLVSDLDFAFMFQAEARPPGGNVGLIVDSVYLDLEGTNSGGVNWGLSERILEFDVALRVAKNLDVLVGGRYFDFETSVSGLPLGISGSASDSWVDPIIGARGALDLGERWRLAGRGDIGGFGVGSEFTWQLEGYALFEAAHWVDLSLGYRILDVDFQDGNADIDLGLSGPVLGAEFRF